MFVCLCVARKEGLHNRTAAAFLLWHVWVLPLVDLTPNGRHHVVSSRIAVIDEAVDHV